MQYLGQNHQEPFFRIGKFPIHGVTAILLLEVLGMLAVVFTQTRITPYVAFEPSTFLEGRIWTLITYPFFSSINLFFVIGLVFFYQFGTMMEVSLGKKRFLTLCGLIIVTSAFVTLLGSFVGWNGVLVGNHIVHFGVFAAFCIVNPNLPSFFNVPIKWFGLAFFFLGLFQYIQTGLWGAALGYVAGIAVGLWYVQEQGLALIRLFPQGAPRKKKTRPTAKGQRQTGAQSRPRPKVKPRVKTPQDTEVDLILDKINEHGLHSLSKEERSLLQKMSRKS